jgi:hypothetical protein
MAKCARKDCKNEGFLSFRGRPDLKFCQGCYEYLGRKIRRIDSDMRRLREAQKRNEAEDNQPARQPRSL